METNVEPRLNILYIGENPLGTRPWTNVQNIAVRLARDNNLLYVENPVSILLFLVSPSLWMFSRRSFSYKGNRILLYTPISIFSVFGRKLPYFQKFDYYVNCLVIGKLLRRLKWNNLILWLFSPKSANYINKFGEVMICYHCTDEYSAAPWNLKRMSAQKIIELEEKILQKADIVFVTSKPLLEKKKQYAKEVYLETAGVDINHFSGCLKKEIQIPNDVAKTKRPRVGYIGAIDKYKVDMKLISYLAKSCPDFSIVMIGKVGVCDDTTSRALPTAKNIHYLGEKDYAILPKYLEGFDVCIIPYNINEYTKYCFPLKVYEYLAAGKPVVTTNLPSLACLKSVIKIAKNKDEFVFLVRQFVERKECIDPKKYLSVARRNSWDDKVKDMIKQVKTSLAKKLRS